MKYFLVNNGQQSGPFELGELLAAGLTPQSYVWNETMPNWLPAMQVPEVAALLNTQQQPPMPPFQQQQPQQQPQYQQQQWNQPQYGQPSQKQMDFGESIKVCFNKFATFDGRARRSEYWWWMLFTLIINSVLCGLPALVFLIPSWAVTARRLHDTGHSGWWQLFNLVPFGFILIIIWCIQDSDPGANEYGPNPKA